MPTTRAIGLQNNAKWAFTALALVINICLCRQKLRPSVLP